MEKVPQHHGQAGDWYSPPNDVKKEIIKHAIRSMPGRAHVLRHCYPGTLNYQQFRVPRHEDTPYMKWAFQN